MIILLSHLQNEDGVTLVLVLIIIALLSILGTGLIASSLMEHKMVQKMEDRKQAFYLAQAGLEYGRFEIQRRLLDGESNLTFSQMETLGKGQFEIDVAEENNYLEIRSKGIVNDAEKILQVEYQYVPGADPVEEISDYPIISDGIVDYKNNVTIHGGETLENYDLPEPDFDKLREDSWIDGYYSADWTPNGFKDDKVNYISDSVSLRNNEDFILDGVLVIEGDWNIKNNINILSQEGLMIFVDGNIEFKNNAIIKASLYATGTITIKNNALIYGNIYSKQKVELGNNIEVHKRSNHIYQPIVKDKFKSDSGSSEPSLDFKSWKEE